MTATSIEWADKSWNRPRASRVPPIMGEARRRENAAYQPASWPGGSKRCPRCFGTKVLCTPAPEGTEFYGRVIAICRCGTAWEPIDESLIWDRDDHVCSFARPCDDCAFRPGAPEQADKEKWLELIRALKAGGTFYCHKGVPIAPGSEHGFAFPDDRRKLRICRGYLDALGKWWGFPEPRPTGVDAPGTVP